LQHFAQPVSSLQHLAHVAGSLQQPPSHFIAGLAQVPSFLQQVAQPVVIRIPAAQTAASSIIVFMFDYLGFFVDLPITKSIRD